MEINKGDVFFKKIFYKCKKFIDSSSKHFCILTGPRKTGKTFCLKQLDSIYTNAKYISFKAISNREDAEEVIASICADESDSIYLLDEITYLDKYDIHLCYLAERFTYENRLSNVKVIITGSQHLAIEYFSHLAFATDAMYVQAGFLDFEEWLDFEHIPEDAVDEDNYKDFLLGSYKFSRIESNEDYLKACIDETIASSNTAARIVYPMEHTDDITLAEIISVAYCSLLSLHNSEKYDTFIKFTDKLDCVRIFFNRLNKDRKISENAFQLAVENTIIYKLNRVNRMTIFRFRRILRILLQADLIVVTYLGTDYNDDLQHWLSSGDTPVAETCAEFFTKYNITFKYPLFYINILNDLVGSLPGITVRELLTDSLLGSIVECHIRGLLSEKDAFTKVYGHNFGYEYKDKDTYAEVDYINYFRKELIEFSISDKPLNKLHFNEVPNHDEYSKLVTSKTKEDDLYIPYYKFILKLSKYNC